MPVRPNDERPGGEHHPFREAAAMPAAQGEPFLLPVEDVFAIQGRGTVVTGRVASGVVRVGDEVDIVGVTSAPVRTVVTGVEMFRKLLDEARAGDNVGVLLRGVTRDQVARGQALVSPRSRAARVGALVSILEARGAAALPPDGAVEVVWHAARISARATNEGDGRVRLAFSSLVPLEPGDEVALRDGAANLWSARVIAALDEE